MINSVRENAERILQSLADHIESECGRPSPGEKLADVVKEASGLTNTLLFDERERMKKKEAGFHDRT